MVLKIDSIEYKRNTVDKGIILGKRKYRWTLKKKYEPLWARDSTSFISELSPHKKDFIVYIPVNTLKKNKTITIQDKDIRRKMRITGIYKSFVQVEDDDEPDKIGNTISEEETINEFEPADCPF